ncbi:hypothetical protein, variant [Blastomyces dermatitidis ATCC 18188]|uniref:Subtelomeric hrmA-associated cluster protein AFUB-079030/YDR124W-like helical bundle domain-containing protein n=1 Tax=Ajellomyces dermatitidis (strain ATCC 18188 / CBS 674.68) TaxID=653446 RepID=A0A0J9EKW8_AJEDA|nr:hypothetical protein, variant [Blastomyces dermatitidis ATCC 18188]
MSSFLSRTNTDGGEKVTPSEAESKKEVNPDCERNAFYTSKFKSLPSEFLCKITKAHVEVAQWRLGRADPGTRPPWWPESVDYADVDKLSEESRVVVNAHIFSNLRIKGEELEGPFKRMPKIPNECEAVEDLSKIYEKKKSES